MAPMNRLCQNFMKSLLIVEKEKTEVKKFVPDGDVEFLDDLDDSDDENTETAQKISSRKVWLNNFEKTKNKKIKSEYLTVEKRLNDLCLEKIGSIDF